MRKLTFLLLVIISLLGIKNSFAQIANWSPVKRLTYGYKDSNPDFGSLQTTPYVRANLSEFLVFQREIDTAIQICVIRFNGNGPADSVKYLTTNNFRKKNPCVAYSFLGFQDTVKNAFALWESNQNGKSDIYGSYYSYLTGWGTAFAVDSGAGNKFNPKAVMFTAAEFGITYERDGDIIYRRYDAAARNVISEVNLTSSLTQICKNPFIALPSANMTICFHSTKPDNSYSLCRVFSTNGGTNWGNIDTFATIGNNKITQLAFYSAGKASCIFESNKSGRNGIYDFTQDNTGIMISSPAFDYYNLKTYFYPIITDNPSFIMTDINAVIRKSRDSIKIMYNFNAQPFQPKDSFTVGDTSKKVTLAMNLGLRHAQGIAFHTVFNLDTAGITSLYYKYRVYIPNDIRYTGNSTSEKYSLYQNYPNPFNPITKIKFDIPKSSDIKLIIFDAVGREVKNITQNNLTAGSYEYEFNGENLSSGIYYFKLQTNEYSKTVKMALVK